MCNLVTSSGRFGQKVLIFKLRTWQNLVQTSCISLLELLLDHCFWMTSDLTFNLDPGQKSVNISLT